ncbi:MAG: sigma-70 family RNA polymerase sigma factor [Ruminococcus sp.]|nr:sigma-70 family RNA polymerase sigma factor [Ruminococcus sp.]
MSNIQELPKRKEVKSVNKEIDEIYRLYAGDVYRFIFRMSRNEALSRDILQDTMLRAVTDYDKFKGKCSVKTWLCTIARNEYYNYLKRSETKNSPLDEAVSDHKVSFEEKLMDSAQAVYIHKIIHHLDEPYKEVFSLRIFAELKFADIGAVFGKTENWARVTFFRAKERIIDIIKKEEEK